MTNLILHIKITEPCNGEGEQAPLCSTPVLVLCILKEYTARKTNSQKLGEVQAE